MSNGRRYPIPRQTFQILLSHLTSPPVTHQIGTEPFVLIRQIIALEVWDKEICHQYSGNTADGRDDEGPA